MIKWVVRLVVGFVIFAVVALFLDVMETYYALDRYTTGVGVKLPSDLLGTLAVMVVMCVSAFVAWACITIFELYSRQVSNRG